MTQAVELRLAQPPVTGTGLPSTTEGYIQTAHDWEAVNDALKAHRRGVDPLSAQSEKLLQSHRRVLRTTLIKAADLYPAAKSQAVAERDAWAVEVLYADPSTVDPDALVEVYRTARIMTNLPRSVRGFPHKPEGPRIRRRVRSAVVIDLEEQRGLRTRNGSARGFDSFDEGSTPIIKDRPEEGVIELPNGVTIERDKIPPTVFAFITSIPDVDKLRTGITPQSLARPIGEILGRPVGRKNVNNYRDRTVAFFEPYGVGVGFNKDVWAYYRTFTPPNGTINS